MNRGCREIVTSLLIAGSVAWHRIAHSMDNNIVAALWHAGMWRRFGRNSTDGVNPLCSGKPREECMRLMAGVVSLAVMGMFAASSVDAAQAPPLRTMKILSTAGARGLVEGCSAW